MIYKGFIEGMLVMIEVMIDMFKTTVSSRIGALNLEESKT